jgi:hypothetical protein
MYLALLVNRTLVAPALLSKLAWAIPIEFAVIHASGFLMWPWVARWQAATRGKFVLLLAVAYTIPLAILALVTRHWYPLTIFWGLMANRMLTVIVSDIPDDEAFTRWTMGWAGATTLYVGAVCIGAVGAQQDVTRALVIGFLYFTSVALSELTSWSWVYRWMQRAREKAGSQARTR